MKISTDTIARILRQYVADGQQEVPVSELLQSMESLEAEILEEERANRDPTANDEKYDKTYILPGEGNSAITFQLLASGDGNPIASIITAVVEHNSQCRRRSARLHTLADAIEKKGAFRKSLKNSPAKIHRILSSFAAVEHLTLADLGALQPTQEEDEQG